MDSARVAPLALKIEYICVHNVLFFLHKMGMGTDRLTGTKSGGFFLYGRSIISCFYYLSHHAEKQHGEV